MPENIELNINEETNSGGGICTCRIGKCRTNFQEVENA